MIGHPYGGVWITNATGQVSLHGDAQVFKVDSSNARLPGRRTVLTDGTFNADGSAILYGTAFQELGTWDLTDPQNPRFTPGAGRREMNWRGTMNADSSICLSLLQYTDGQLPAAEVTFDNCEVRRYSVPSLSIANAVRLTWPAVAAPFAVEGSSTVTGPWLPVLEPVFESGNVKQVTVPTADAMKFFRLR